MYLIVTLDLGNNVVSTKIIAKGFDTLREKERLEDALKSILRHSVCKVRRFRRLSREKFITDVYRRLVFQIVQITDLSIIRTLMRYKLHPTGSSPEEIGS